jgi:hypothetical protein
MKRLTNERSLKNSTNLHNYIYYNIYIQYPLTDGVLYLFLIASFHNNQNTMTTTTTLLAVAVAVLVVSANAFLSPASTLNTHHDKSSPSPHALGLQKATIVFGESSRRQILQTSGAAVLASLVGVPPPANAALTGASDGNLPDLPPEAAKSYLQYRLGMQLSADYYMWELQELLEQTDNWGEVAQLFQSSSARGAQGSPSRMERQFINPMRIIGLSMPPDVAEQMQDSQYAFERAMAGITKVTAGIRRDLSVEVDPNAVGNAKKAWEEGRVAYNSFLTALNTATGMPELRLIPPAGPNQNAEYGRSQRKYLDLMKKTKLCQNRGGPALASAWGQLMVSGYLQDSCGIPDLDAYFFQ